jgi:hypothetical protein
MADDFSTVDRREPTQHVMDEANRILFAAKEMNVTLKLVGGWAIHVHCSEHDFCDREHPDIDFVGLRTEYERIVQLMEAMGYGENRNMTLSTGLSRLLFEKPDSSDHIDIFLDFIDIEHFINLKDRLEIEEDTLSVTDLLLIKATISRLNEKDVRDIVTMVKDLDVGADDTPGLINRSYIAELCSKRWGLHHDIVAALKKTIKLLPMYEFSEDTNSLVTQRLESILAAIHSVPKSLRWRIRALIGERIGWRRPVETLGVTIDGRGQ